MRSNKLTLEDIQCTFYKQTEGNMKTICEYFLVLITFIIYSQSIAQDTNATITKINIEQAEKVIGLKLTDAERDSLISDAIENLKSYHTIRKIEIENSIPPAVLFNPIPVGFAINEKQLPLKFSGYSNAELPSEPDDFAFYSIGELAELMRTKQITSMELTKFFLARLKEYGPKLECVITLTEELALKQAARADEEIAVGKYRGMLHGIPYGAKDLLAVRGYKTTWGAAPYKDQIIDQDAAVIKKLEEAGAVLVAKLTMGALAWGDVWFGGQTRNPWKTSKGSSGSSAGSASAASAGLVPFAIGTETWGSIVSPATVCGVTGLRPTYGRVSRTGAMALSWSMDKIGPICRNAEDLAIVFNAIKGEDGIDQIIYDFPFNYSPEIDFSKIKVGYLKSDFDKEYAFHKNDSLTLLKLKELGAKLIPIELPDIPVGDISFILSAEAAAAFDELTRSNEDDLLVRQIKNAWPNVFRSSRFIPAVEYINANRLRHLLIQEMAVLMKTVDLYIAPSWAGDNLLLTNLTGHPCVVLPNGFTEDGTPTSISFIGNLFDEGKLIAFAKKYQDATDHHRKHPVLK
jgi:Asp-tRNA(Asn)/Glu-tRNA(Gln) amidotransferase A subunit family amidase